MFPLSAIKHAGGDVVAAANCDGHYHKSTLRLTTTMVVVTLDATAFGHV